MAETEEQRLQRCLDELKGKNVAHYSVMLAAYINARIDANRAILVLSSTGIGLLIAMISKLQSMNVYLKITYVAAIAALLGAACTTLWIHANNAKTIESYIRAQGTSKSMKLKLDASRYINYLLFLSGLTLALIVIALSLFLST
jgi:hypothetical protein